VRQRTLDGRLEQGATEDDVERGHGEHLGQDDDTLDVVDEAGDPGDAERVTRLQFCRAEVVQATHRAAHPVVPSDPLVPA